MENISQQIDTFELQKTMEFTMCQTTFAKIGHMAVKLQQRNVLNTKK